MLAYRTTDWIPSLVSNLIKQEFNHCFNIIDSMNYCETFIDPSLPQRDVDNYNKGNEDDISTCSEALSEACGVSSGHVLTIAEAVTCLITIQGPLHLNQNAPLFWVHYLPVYPLSAAQIWCRSSLDLLSSCCLNLLDREYACLIPEITICAVSKKGDHKR